MKRCTRRFVRQGQDTNIDQVPHWQAPPMAVELIVLLVRPKQALPAAGGVLS